MPSEPAKDEFSRVLDEAVTTLSRFTVPLYRDVRGKPEQFGSGFFLESGGRVVLVSAAHVLRTAKDQTIYYYISKNEICRLDGKLILGKGGGGDDDHIDVAGLVLSERTSLPKPETGKVAVPLSYLAPRYLPRTGKQYLIVGYPSTKNEANPVAKSVTARPYAYHEDSATLEAYEKLGLSQAGHIVIPLNLRKGFDSSGQQVTFPKPNGISGSPLWVLYEEAGKDAHRTFPLVGVGIEYRWAEKLLVATDSQEVLGLLRAAI